MKRTAQEKEVRREYMEMINHNKDIPIRESKKEKKEYIMKEIQSIRENGAINYIDKIRYDILLKIIQ